MAMDRYVLVAHLKPGSRERAQELLAEHPMHEGMWASFDREAIFLSKLAHTPSCIGCSARSSCARSRLPGFKWATIT